MIKFVMKGKGLIPFNTNWWGATQTQWAPILLQENRRIWPSQRDPSNRRPWAALSPTYRKWKEQKYPGNPILKLSGNMLNSAEVFPKGSGFSVLSTNYGRYNQFGTSKMPKRPWMGLPREALQKLPAIAWSNILKR